MMFWSPGYRSSYWFQAAERSGDGLIRGVPAPASTWPGDETSADRSQASAAALPSDPMCSISRDPRRDEYTSLRGHRSRHRLHCPHI